MFHKQRGIELSNAEFLFVDLVITTSLAFMISRAGPARRLMPHRPIMSLVAPSNVIPLLLHITATALIQYSALLFLEYQDW